MNVHLVYDEDAEYWLPDEGDFYRTYLNGDFRRWEAAVARARRERVALERRQNLRALVQACQIAAATWQRIDADVRAHRRIWE